MSFCDFGLTKRVEVHHVEGGMDGRKVIINAIEVELHGTCNRISVTDAEVLQEQLGALLAHLKKGEAAGHLVFKRE